MRQLNVIAVAVSELSIQVLQLNEDNTIRAYGQGVLEEGVVEKGCIVDPVSFSQVLHKILSETKPQVLANENSILRGFLSVPEGQLFTHHAFVPETVSEKEIETYVYAEAGKIIPIELSSLYWNVHVAPEGGVRNATFVGVEKSILDSYVKAFVQAKLRPAFVSSELSALGRALLPQPPLTEDYIILDIGRRSTTIGMFSVDSVPNDSIVIPFGGDYFTAFLANRLGISLEEAETLKRAEGVDIALKESQVPRALRESLTVIVDKVQEAKKYFEAKTGNPLSRIIIAGGSALLPQIDTYFTETVGIPASIADPLAKITTPTLLQQSGVPPALLATVIGLALGASATDFTQNNLLIKYHQDDRDMEHDAMDVREVRSVTDLKQVGAYFLRKIKTSMISYVSDSKQITLRISTDRTVFLAIILLTAAFVFLGWVIKIYT